MAATLPPGGTEFTFIPIVPQKGKDVKLNFRAFINSLSDSYSPAWGEHMDMGRADPKFMFNQYARNLTLDFKIMALKRGEHITNMEAMNYLTQLTYPIYKPGQGFNGVYVQLYIGEFINEIGLISSLSFNIDNESPWVDDIPLYIECSLDFRCIGDKKPNYKRGLAGPYSTNKYGVGIK